MAEEEVCVPEKEEKLATEIKIGNPAVVGLAGFGMTTLLLQFHNLGWVAISPIIWLGFIFGGFAQLIAGFLEFRTGNNFGFCAFSGYGAFWISLAFLVIFGTSPSLTMTYPTLALKNGLPCAFWQVPILKAIAAWDLIGCALLAWYLMWHVICAEAGINIPLGPAWI
ncbi:MAG: acetate uptake transporter [Syntrophobacterales bacterium]